VLIVNTETTALKEREIETEQDAVATVEFCNSCDAMVLPGGYCNCR
jgi:hypothetical protein